MIAPTQNVAQSAVEDENTQADAICLLVWQRVALSADCNVAASPKGVHAFL